MTEKKHYLLIMYKDVVIIVLLAIVLGLIWNRHSSGFLWFNKQGRAVNVGIAKQFGYSGENGVDYPGNDISELDGKHEFCAAVCNKTDGCVGFIREPSSGHCWLKSSMQNRREGTNKNAFTKQMGKGAIKTAENSSGGYTALRDTDCYKDDANLGYQGIKSEPEIRGACDANPDCIGDTMHTGGDWWLLKKSDSITRNSSPGSGCIFKTGRQEGLKYGVKYSAE